MDSERNTLIEATEVAHDLRPIQTTEEAIAAVRERLAQRDKLPHDDWIKAQSIARQSMEFVLFRFELIVDALRRETGYAEAQGVGFFTNSGFGDATLALGEVHLSLTLRADDRMLHGLFIIEARLVSRLVEIPLNSGTFQINYEEDRTSIQNRLGLWLEALVVQTLNRWRRTL
jgi:hypothetical protein